MNNQTLLSINELSRYTGVQQSKLRYYDEIGLLPPAIRGENNYRYYLPMQIITLNFINVMIDLGIPLSIIKEMNTSRTPQKIAELLSRQEHILDGRLHELRTAYSIIHTILENIQTATFSDENEISVRELGESKYALGAMNDFKDNESFYEAFISFCNSARRNSMNLRYPIGGYFETMGDFISTPSRPNRFFSQDPFGSSTRPAGKYLVGYQRGYYADTGNVTNRLESYACKHEIKITGPVFMTYLLDEICIVDPSQYLACIVVGIHI